MSNFHRNFKARVRRNGISAAASNRVGQNELGCGSKTNSSKFRQNRYTTARARQISLRLLVEGG